MNNEDELIKPTTAPGDVICEPLGLAFPSCGAARRMSQTSDLAGHEFGGEIIESSEWIEYEFAPDQVREIGTVSWREARFLETGCET